MGGISQKISRSVLYKLLLDNCWQLSKIQRTFHLEYQLTAYFYEKDDFKQQFLK